MDKDHDRKLVSLPSPIRPINIQAQAILRSISEDSQIQRQKVLADTDILRARWPRTISRDERPRTRCEWLRRIEAVRTRRVLSILDTEKRFNTILVSAAIRHVVVELNRLVPLATRVRLLRAGLVGEAHCGQEEGQRQVAEHLWRVVPGVSEEGLVLGMSMARWIQLRSHFWQNGFFDGSPAIFGGACAIATRMRVAVANPASLMSIMFKGVHYCSWASPGRIMRFAVPSVHNKYKVHTTWHGR